VLVAGLHTGPMSNPSQLPDWLTWWSWPWRMMSAWASPSVSLAPQTLSQPILPGWIFANTVDVTDQNSSSPETERQIVAAHSYGQQLGRVLDAVNELIAERPAGAPDVQAIRDFTQLWRDVEKIKTQSAAERIEQAITELAEMKSQRYDEYQRLAARLQNVLETGPPPTGAQNTRPDR
jgi:hypothetical protein